MFDIGYNEIKRPRHLPGRRNHLCHFVLGIRLREGAVQITLGKALQTIAQFDQRLGNPHRNVLPQPQGKGNRQNNCHRNRCHQQYADHHHDSGYVISPVNLHVHDGGQLVIYVVIQRHQLRHGPALRYFGLFNIRYRSQIQYLSLQFPVPCKFGGNIPVNILVLLGNHEFLQIRKTPGKHLHILLVGIVHAAHSIQIVVPDAPPQRRPGLRKISHGLTHISLGKSVILQHPGIDHRHYDQYCQHHHRNCRRNS